MTFFDATTIERKHDFELLPVGTYQVIIDSAEYKPTKAGTGHFISVQFSILTEGYSGRKIFSNFNIDNPNQAAREIGQSDFAKFLDALNITKIESVDHLVHLANKMMLVKVKVRREKNGQMKNEIEKYIGSNETVVTPVAAQTTTKSESIPF